MRLLAGIGLGLLLTIAPANAYVLSTNSSGQTLKWSSSPSPTYYVRWTNSSSSGLSYSQVFNAFTKGLQRWKYAGSGSLDFDYWQGNNSATPSGWGYNGKNAVYFTSESSQKLSSSTIAVTYVFSSSGTIVETDIAFNDDNFIFTTDATSSSAFGDTIHVFLENVGTHEFGHSLGLGHSAVLQSTMVFLEHRAQAKLSCDDIQGLAALYPASSFTSGRGSISGTVKSGATNVFGAHVLAVSKTRGTVVEGAISQSDGTYSLTNLEPGDYTLLYEPFGASSPLNPLCGGSASGCSYGTVNSNSVCSGSTAFKRGFLESSAGTPTLVSVTAGNNTAAGQYSVSCTAMTGGTPSTTAGGAATLASNNAGAAVSVAQDMVMGATQGTEHYYKLDNVSGSISAKVLAYSLYSPFDPEVTILGSDGATAATGVSTTANVFTNSSSFTNYDASATLSSAPTGAYYVRVKNANNLGSSQSSYPAGIASGQLDSIRYYLLLVTINDTTSLLPSTASPTMTNNARCEASDGFSAFTDHGPPAVTTSQSTSSGSSDGGGGGGGSSSGGGGGGFCGIIYDEDGGGGGPGGGPGPSALFSSWGIVFLLVLFRGLAKLMFIWHSPRSRSSS